MPLSVAGARPPAPSSGLQAFRLLTPVSSATRPPVTNPAAFVTHTTASVTHTTACVTNAAVSELIEAQAVICCRARQQKSPSEPQCNQSPARSEGRGRGRGEGGPCTVLLSRPAINTDADRPQPSDHAPAAPVPRPSAPETPAFPSIPAPSAADTAPPACPSSPKSPSPVQDSSP